MKKIVGLLAIIALVFGMMFVVACDNGNGGGASDSGELPPSGENPEENVPVNIFQRGDFSDSDNIWEIWPAYAADDSASLKNDAAYSDGVMTVSIQNEGTVAHGIQLQYKPLLTFEVGATYEVSFDVKSSKARNITAMFQDATYDNVGWKQETLEANNNKPVKYEFTFDKDASTEYGFVVNMGKDGETTLGEHTLVFDNFKLIKK